MCKEKASHSWKLNQYMRWKLREILLAFWGQREKDEEDGREDGDYEGQRQKADQVLLVF